MYIKYVDKICTYTVCALRSYPREGIRNLLFRKNSGIIYVEKKRKGDIKMRPNFDTINELFATALGTLSKAADELIHEANSQRRELIGLFNRMNETKHDLHDLGNVLEKAGNALYELGEKCHDIGDKVNETLECGAERLPEIDYENVEDYCNVCGGVIAHGDEYDVSDGNWVVCSHCTVDTDATNESDPV